MSNAIIYTRVSTDEQANKGYSLPHQHSVLSLYCGHRHLTVLKHFQEDYSAKNFDRPAFNQLLQYVKANKKTIDYFLFTRWDRFSRNIEAAYRMIREFKEMGIVVNAIEQPLDLSQPDSKVMLAVYLAIPEVENDKNSIRTTEGMRRAMKEGCFTGIAPFGYVNHRNSLGKSTLAIHEEKAVLVRKVFNEYAKGIFSTEQVRKKYYSKGFKVTKQSLLNMLKNPTYCGKIYLKPYKKENEHVVEGLHPAIIDVKTFERVQNILRGKRVPKVHKYSDIDNELPLRGYLQCPSCYRNLTGSASKGRNGKKHFYYHCQPGCKIRFKAEHANILFEQVLSELVIKEDVLKLYKNILDQTFHGNKQNRSLRVREIREELKKLQKRKDVIEEKYVDDLLDQPAYHSIKEKTLQKIGNLNAELSEIKAVEKDFDLYLKQGISFLHGVDKLYKTSSTDIKKKIIGSIFPEKLVFLKNKYRTAYLDSFIALILRNHAGFRKLEIETPRQNGEESRKAPPLGLEPRTL